MKAHGSGILDAELLWFFNEAAGEMGIRAMPLEPSIHGDADGEPTERQVEAASKHRRISAALFSLSHPHQKILRLAHEPLPVALRPSLQKLGDLAAVVLAIATAPATYGRSDDDRFGIFRAIAGPAEVIERLQGRAGAECAGKLRAAAEIVIAVALKEFRDARRTVSALEKDVRQRRHEDFMRRLRDGRDTRAGAALYLAAEVAKAQRVRPASELVDRPGRAGLWPLAKGRCA